MIDSINKVRECKNCKCRVMEFAIDSLNFDVNCPRCGQTKVSNFSEVIDLREIIKNRIAECSQ